MAEAILDALGAVLTRWTMGGSADAVAPAAWRDALGDDPQEAELRLLALSGQFLGALALAEPVGEIRVRADLPRLAKPPLAAALRPRARRVLQQVREPGRRRDLLGFLDRRGWTLHPGDWLPGPNDDVPEVYAPWQDWAADKAGPDTEALTEDSWDSLPPAARRVAFAQLRRQDPVGAGALLEEKIGAEPADVRVRLVELLAIGLSEADRALLERLKTDRAPRVQALVTVLLAQLGHAVDGGEEAAELAAFFPVQTKGLLRRTRVIVPQVLKTPAQRNRRAALMGVLSLAGLARALDLSAEELVAAWPWGSDAATDRALAEMAARSAPDAVIAMIARVLGSLDDPGRFVPLVPRLSPDQRRAAAMALLRDGSFVEVLAVAGGEGAIEDALRTPAGARLLDALKVEDARPDAQAAELLALGLVASRRAAGQALKDLAAAGLIASDPRLDMLRLNAALDKQGVTE
jgi:hypothetical protein